MLGTKQAEVSKLELATEALSTLLRHALSTSTKETMRLEGEILAVQKTLGKSKKPTTRH